MIHLNFWMIILKSTHKHTKTKDAVSKKQIPFDVPPHMKHTAQSPNVYLPKSGENFICTDDKGLYKDCFPLNFTFYYSFPKE